MILISPHCSKCSFFVQKINFDFPRKLSIFFGGEKLVKMLWFWTFLAVDNFDFTRKIVKKKLGEKLVKMLWFWLTILISWEKLGEKLVKMLWFCFWTKIWLLNPVKKFSSKFVYIQARPCRTQFNLTNFFTLKISILTRILLCLHFFHFNEYFQSKLKQPKHKILWSTILPLLKNLWPLLTLWKTSRTTKRTRKLFLRLCLIRTSKPR